MDTSSKPRASSPCLMAPTRPSIMSDGATTWAPASACDTAVSTRWSTVTSLRMVSPSRMPQWPCDVYSQRQTSVTTATSSSRPRIARIAVCTGAAGSAAAVPCSSLWAGSPNSSTARTPSARAAAASSTAASTES